MDLRINLSCRRDSLSEKKNDKTEQKAKQIQKQQQQQNKTKTMKQIYFSDMCKIPDDCSEARLVHIIPLNVISASFS